MSTYSNSDKLLITGMSCLLLGIGVGHTVESCQSEQRISGIKQKISKTPQTNMFWENRTIMLGDTATKERYIPAHIVPDSLLLKL